MQRFIIGWDIGGAHVKAAMLDDSGVVLQVIQRPCPLWKGLSYLEAAIDAVLMQLPREVERHAVTMTGELVDCFSSREQGVEAILHTLQGRLPKSDIRVFAGNAGFISLDDVRSDEHMAIASANWLASAQLAARCRKNALFVDIGSTTSDILRIESHAVQAVGHTDYERLVSGELVYTGIVRTAVMAVAQRAVFNGRDMGLMAEYFATMADVYRLTGDLNEAHDQSETADGADKSPVASARRLSRMTGFEFVESDWPLWLAFAQELKRQQRALIHEACLQQLGSGCDQAKDLCLIGAGVGRFLAKEIAADLGLGYVDFTALLRQGASVGDVDAADCAPAVAVAYLAAGFG